MVQHHSSIIRSLTNFVRRSVCFFAAFCLLLSSGLAESGASVSFTTDRSSIVGIFQTVPVESKKLTAQGDKYFVEVEYPEDAGIPEDAALVATEITRESADYALYKAQAAAALGADDVELPGLFDLGIYKGEEKIQPSAPVTVSIRLNEGLSAGKTLHIIHFQGDVQKAAQNDAETEEQPETQADSGIQEGNELQVESELQAEATLQAEAELLTLQAGPRRQMRKSAAATMTAAVDPPAQTESAMTTELITPEVSDQTVTFSATGFSVYALAYTVDFHYTDKDDGEPHTYSIAGGTYITLSDLLVITGIVEDDPDEVQDFLSQIEDVTFSDPSLIFVTKAERDITIGEIWEENGLEINFSSELTGEDIAEIAAQAVKAGDCVLISLQAFSTDEELVITLIDNEQLRIKITDYYDNTTGYLTVNDTSMGSLRLHGGNYERLDGNNPYFAFENGYNTEQITAQAADGYIFWKWTVTTSTETHDAMSADLQDSVILPGKLSEEAIVQRKEIVIAYFRPAVHLTVKINEGNQSYGTFSTRYLSNSYKNTITAEKGASFTGIGAYISKAEESKTRLACPISPVADAGYQFAMWKYYDNETSHWRSLPALTDQTIIPYDRVEYEGYFAPDGQNMFIYYSDEGGSLTGRDEGGYSYSSDGAVCKAVPNSNRTFDGWYDSDGNLVCSYIAFDPSMANRSLVLYARFRDRTKVNYTATVNNTSWGYLNGKVNDISGDYTVIPALTKVDGKINNKITAKPYSGFAFSHWTLNGELLPNEPAQINPNAEENNQIYLHEGDVLTAVFMPVTQVDSGNYTPGVPISVSERERLLDWMNSLTNNYALQGTSKTAQVEDYENRIYKINLKTSSGLMDLSADIDLAFMLDVSGSMKFPSKLVTTGTSMVLTQDVLNDLAAIRGSEGPYYIISDPTGQSTVFRIFNRDGKWYGVDASYSDDRGVEITGNDRFNEQSGSAPFSYEVYIDGGNGRTRYEDLNASLQNAISTTRTILNKAYKGDSAADIRIAYNTFCKELKDSQEQFLSLKDDSVAISLPATEGGTRQDLALENAQLFNWGSDSKKYAILITDGAPVPSGDVTADYIWGNIPTQAKNLKDQGVTLITIGLSTKNVKGGSGLLYSIASNINNEKQFYEAGSGDELSYILMRILQTIMTHANIVGNISDTIDPAFYPVLEDGTPVTEGNYTNSGIKFGSDVTEEYLIDNGWSFYNWKVEDGKWKITWYTQGIGWESYGQGWNQSIYVKAKEDFLGGNVISTNYGKASFLPTGIFTGQSTSVDSMYKLENEKPVEVMTPYVNVDELSINQNNTTWTVYLGADVDPLTQMKALFSELKINEVVSAADADNRRSQGSKLKTEEEFVANTFPLSDVTGELSNDQWNSLMGGQNVSIPYTIYGHSDVGTINISLTQEVKTAGEVTEDDLTPSPHATTIVADEAERYVLTVTYAPTAESNPAGGWHTTAGGSRGDVTESISSENRHVINVRPIPLRIEKQDQDGEIIEESATFGLYRAGKTGESGAELDGLDTKQYGYIQVGQNIVTVDGSASVESLALLPNGTDGYYLIEKSAPNGYSQINGYVKIEPAVTGNDFTLLNGNDATSGDITAGKAHNWTQSVSISINKEGLDEEEKDLVSIDTTNASKVIVKNKPVKTKLLIKKKIEDLLADDTHTQTMYFVIRDKETNRYLKEDGTLTNITQGADGNMDYGLGNAKMYFFKDFTDKTDANNRSIEIEPKGLIPGKTYIVEEIGQGIYPYDVYTWHAIGTETETSGAAAEFTVSETENETIEVSFRNKYATRIYVTKRWKLGDADYFPADAQTIFFRVYWTYTFKDNNGNDVTVDEPYLYGNETSLNNATAVGSVTFNTENNKWSEAHITGLRPFVLMNGSYVECRYYVVETDSAGNGLSNPYFLTTYGNRRIETPSVDASDAMILDSYRENGEDRMITITNTTPLTNIEVFKTDDGSPAKPLTGAVFQLKQGDDIVDIGTSGNGIIVSAKVTGESVTVTNNTFTIPEGGVIIEKIPASDTAYTLVEVSAPAGYMIANDQPVSFTFKGNTMTVAKNLDAIVYVEESHSFTVPNSPGVELPSTGGPGTMIYTMFGLALVLLAGGMLIRRKRRNNG